MWANLRLCMFAAMLPLLVWPYFVDLPGSDADAAGSVVDELTGPGRNFDYRAVSRGIDSVMSAVTDQWTGGKTNNSSSSFRGATGSAAAGEEDDAGGDGGGVSALSYSLYGTGIRYTWGMVAAAKAARSAFPGWKVYVYHDGTVPHEILEELSTMTHVLLIDVEGDLPDWVHRDLNPMSWRFLIASDPNVDVYAIRDGDSRPTPREKAAVDEWLRSGKSFHIMRDHPMHNPVQFAPILGGMWGGLHRAIPNMESLLREYYGAAKKIRYAEDQNFLWQNVMPLAWNDCMQHDSYYCFESGAIAFPMTRAEAGAPYDYVGRVYQFNERDEAVDPRLTNPHYHGRYIDCLAVRDSTMKGLRAKNSTAVPITTYRGKVSGSSTESWDKWRADMKNQAAAQAQAQTQAQTQTQTQPKAQGQKKPASNKAEKKVRTGRKAKILGQNVDSDALEEFAEKAVKKQQIVKMKRGDTKVAGTL